MPLRSTPAVACSRTRDHHSPPVSALCDLVEALHCLALGGLVLGLPPLGWRT